MRRLAQILIFPTVLFTLLTLGCLTARAGGGQATGDLKVMTWNVAGGRCGRDLAMSPFAREIREHQPDVAAIQEVHRDQAARLAEATGMHVFFVGTKDCRGEVPDFGIAILSRTPFEPGSGKAYPFFSRNRLLNANHPADSARREFRKMAGVSIRVGGRLLRIYNTHLTAVGPSSAFLNYYRTRQARRILDYLADDQRESAERFSPILMGDFNSEPFTYAYGILLSKFSDAGPLRKGTTTAGTRVDYIFLGRDAGLTVVDVGVLAAKTRSDHFPVVARLALN